MPAEDRKGSRSVSDDVLGRDGLLALFVPDVTGLLLPNMVLGVQ